MIDFIKKVLQTSDASELMSNHDVVMWVDWREEDDAIVSYCEDILKTGKLSAECKDSDNERGFEIWIYYDGKEINIPYKGKGADRDTTLITLNDVLNPMYEIRLWRGSLGGDTLAFVPMKTEEWNDLEKEFGLKKLENEFMRIKKGVSMFKMSMDDVFRLVHEYNVYKGS